MLRHGEAWGAPPDRATDLALTATDAELCAALGASDTTPLVAWTPQLGSDLARSVGRTPLTQPEGTLALPMDAIARCGQPGVFALNSVVVGRAPGSVRSWHRSTPIEVHVDGRMLWSGPAWCVAILNGDFLDGMPIGPRTHPGDGWLDVQVYAVPAGQRRELRGRLRRGDHLPHPNIATARARRVTIASRNLPLLVDQVRRAPCDSLDIVVASNHWNLLV